MAAKPGMRVSRYFKLNHEQAALDFVDVPIGNDLRVYLDPSRLRTLENAWANSCNSILQHFFETLLRHLKDGNEVAGRSMLANLTEKNEFHFGQSQGLSDGRAFGDGYAKKIWSALQRSKASTSGLLKDIEDTCLFIDGIGADRISDAVCNIIRGPLIQYTQDMCVYYGIPLTPDVDSGPIWDPVSERWENELVPLPVTPYGKLLLVPKIIVRHQITYDYASYMTHYLLPAMQESEKQLNSALVYTLRDGRAKVNKKDLREKYGADKLAIVNQTLRHPGVLTKYRNEILKASRPMSHEKLSEVANIPLPNLSALFEDVVAVTPGRADATAYENAIEKLMSALFYPSLTYPKKQEILHEGRKRVDIRYMNDAAGGFFAWVAQHYPAGQIFVECKNYTEDIANQEFDQMAGRFSPSRGKVGLLVCRKAEKPSLILKRSIDAAKDDRGFIIVLTDDDLKQLVHDYVHSDIKVEYPLLRKKFLELVN